MLTFIQDETQAAKIEVDLLFGTCLCVFFLSFAKQDTSEYSGSPRSLGRLGLYNYLIYRKQRENDQSYETNEVGYEILFDL